MQKKFRQIKMNLRVICLIVFCVFSCAEATITFQGLGFLAETSHPYLPKNSYASGVSADGSTVVGSASNTKNELEAFRWTKSGGMVGLGHLSSTAWGSAAEAVSADGSVVVGSSQPYNSEEEEGFRWKNGIMGGIGKPAGYMGSYAYGVSDNGLVIVGEMYPGIPREAFRWENGVMTGLGSLPGGSYSSALGVSANGSIIVGSGISNTGNWEAFRWENDVMTGLGYLPGDTDSIANNVSSDGSVIVGHSDYHAFRWEDGVMTALGFLSEGDSTDAKDVSANGSVIVGRSGENAFIWDEENGMRNLKELLENNFGLNLTGWTLSGATGISADGKTIVGYGINPEGYSEGWIVTIPEPGTVLLLGLGAMLARRRTNRA